VITRVFRIAILMGAFNIASTLGASSQLLRLAKPTLSGAIYVARAQRATTARPVLGYRVYVSATDSGAGWTGPAFTDEYGRFAFYNLRPGRYLLRIFDANGQRVWQQLVTVPGALQSIVVVAPKRAL
jgi:hypothetical protein